MSKQKNCGVVVACSLLVAFALAQGQEGVPTKTTADARAVQNPPLSYLPLLCRARLLNFR
jgi:hypothetical protein